MGAVCSSISDVARTNDSETHYCDIRPTGHYHVKTNMMAIVFLSLAFILATCLYVCVCGSVCACVYACVTVCF